MSKAPAKALEWYLPDRNSLDATGPYTTEQVHEKIKSGECSVDEYIWGSHFGDAPWKRILEIPEFKDVMRATPKFAIPKRSRGMSTQQKQVNLVYKESGNYGSENVYRRYPRVPMTVEVIIRTQHKYRRCKSVDLSENGVFVLLDDAMAFEKGHEVIATIRNAPGIGTFSAPCVVVRVNKGDKNRGYGLSFLRLNPNIRNMISRYILEQLKLVAVEKEKTGEHPAKSA